jgi:sugar phosphate isomerase/epimerase
VFCDDTFAVKVQHLSDGRHARVVAEVARLLSIAAATLADLSPADTVIAAARAGFDGAGIWFDPSTWTDAVTRDVAMRLDDTGLTALDVEPVILSDGGDPGDRLVDTAARLGARHVLVASRRADAAWVTDRFAQLCQRAAATGLGVVLEFLPIFGIRSLSDALRIVMAADQPNGGVLVDSLHLARSGGSPADVCQVRPGLLPYIQIADAPALPPDASLPGLLDEAIHGRSLPGEGELPLRDLVRAVPHVALSVELRSRSLVERHPDPYARAKAVFDSSLPLARL